MPAGFAHGGIPPRGAAAAGLRATVMVVVFAVLAGCGTRGSIAIVDPVAARASTPKTVIVATSRAPAPAPEFFTSERSHVTNFATFEVAIPPERRPGTVEYPKGKPDPERDFLVTGAQRLDGERGFIAEVNRELAELPSGSRSGVLFVHGFNSNFAESLFKDAQLRHDLKTPGIGVMFTWPSAAKFLGYVADRESTLFSRDALAETMRAMARTRLTGYTIVAHSMGTFLAMETLRTMALTGDPALKWIDSVVLISADIEVDVFRRQAPPVLDAGIPIILVVSDDDRALKAAAVLRGERDRLGSVRSPEELGGLDVTILDVSGVEGGNATRHFKVSSSPELIAFIQQIRDRGISVFEDEQRVGLITQSVAVIQGATGLILRPLAN
jgi:esterase/lipase superfamily enzyme